MEVVQSMALGPGDAVSFLFLQISHSKWRQGSVNAANKLKVILNDNRIEKAILPSQPDSLNELISTLKEKLHLKFDFSLLYEDPDVNNELFNLETIEDLPSPRATGKFCEYDVIQTSV